MRKSCLLTFSAKKGPRESQHPAAKKVLSVDSSKPGLARLSLVVNAFFSRDADLRTVSVLERLRLRRKTVKTGINPRTRKYPPEYPRSGPAKSPAISRTYEKYPQYPQNPRDVGDADGRAYMLIYIRKR